MVTREKMKKEAIERMEMLHLMRNVIREFDQENVLNLSEGRGLLYWLNEKEKQLVADFEMETNYLVYHVIHNLTQFGEMYCLLYVNTYEEEWELDRDDIKDGYALVYVINVDHSDCSEFGSITISPMNGGLVRIG